MAYKSLHIVSWLPLLPYVPSLFLLLSWIWPDWSLDIPWAQQANLHQLLLHLLHRLPEIQLPHISSHGSSIPSLCASVTSPFSNYSVFQVLTISTFKLLFIPPWHFSFLQSIDHSVKSFHVFICFLICYLSPPLECLWGHGLCSLLHS